MQHACAPNPQTENGMFQLVIDFKCVYVCWVLLPMPKWWDEVEAAVDSVVLNVLPVQSTLIPEVLLKLLIYVVCDWLPAGTHAHTHKYTHIFIKSRQCELKQAG